MPNNRLHRPGKADDPRRPSNQTLERPPHPDRAGLRPTCACRRAARRIVRAGGQLIPRPLAKKEVKMEAWHISYDRITPYLFKINTENGFVMREIVT